MRRDDDLERRQLREACLAAMPFPGESQLRVTLFQWAREGSPRRVLRVLQENDQLRVHVASLEKELAQAHRDANREDITILQAQFETDIDNCQSIARAFYRAVKDLPGVWPTRLRDVMQRAEAAGLHRFD